MENDELIKIVFELKNDLKTLKSKFSGLEKENKDLRKDNKLLRDLLRNEKSRNNILEKQVNSLKTTMENKINKRVQGAINETTQHLTEHFESIIRNKDKRITELEKVLNTDSSNSSLPSSKNRIGKKVIPNNREKSDKKIGGQIGHKIHKLDYFKDYEITNTIEHTLDSCPNCGGKLKEINVVKSDIIDIEIKVTKTRNNIHNYKCDKCKKSISANNDMARGISYGNNVNALALSLLNESNVAYNKVQKHIYGISNGEIDLSEGYLSKLQKKASNNLDTFINDLRRKILTLNIVHWDDTSVKIQSDIENKNNNKIREASIRFYGDDNYALLIGHNKKDENSIIEDGILPNLSSDCTCMHDHLLINYKDKYKFKNAECNSHILRYLKGIKDNIHNHNWQDVMAKLLKELNEKRNLYIEKGIMSFTEEEIENAYKEYDMAIQMGYDENKKLDDYHFYKDDEKNLIKRLDKYKNNHLLFIKDFNVPFTNNTAERGLRQTKRKLAVSFLFKNINTMKDYAKITSYLETCYRNNITRYDALRRLCSNNPYTLEELDSIQK